MVLSLEPKKKIINLDMFTYDIIYLRNFPSAGHFLGEVNKSTGVLLVVP